MTGFGRFQSDDGQWIWELRAVNGKGLDIRLRLPSGYERLENEARGLCKQALARGNVQVALSVSRGVSEARPSINQSNFDALVAALKTIDDAVETRPSSAAEILSLRGVLEMTNADPDEQDVAVQDKAILVGLEQALVALNTHRQQEGQALHTLLNEQINRVDALRKSAEDDPFHTVEATKARLQKQLDLLLDGETRLDEQRLHQEAALLATKSDIREELDRLAAHVIAARDLLEEGSPVGRKLEFLAQEFNRETNTMCSKSSSTELTAIGLELKLVIDQFREQVLNVE